MKMKLRPCLSCGAKARYRPPSPDDQVVTTWDSSHMIECSSRCGWTAMTGPTVSEVAIAWNLRNEPIERSKERARAEARDRLR